MSTGTTPALNAKQFYPYLNPQTGLIEIIDCISGEIVAVQKTKEDLWQHKEANMVRVEVDGREVWLEKGVSADRIPRRKHWVYSEVLGELIAQKVMEGTLLTKLCNGVDFPSYSQVCRWRAKYSEFADLLESARKFRAEKYHDDIVELSEDKEADEEEVARRRLEIESKKWLAEKNDNSRFGNKTKVEGMAGATVLLVNTGIQRPGDEGFREVQDVRQEGLQVHNTRPTADGGGGQYTAKNIGGPPSSDGSGD